MLGLDTLMHAAKAVETVLLDMKSGKFARRNDGMDFEEYKRVVGFDKWESMDDRFGSISLPIIARRARRSYASTGSRFDVFGSARRRSFRPRMRRALS